MKVNVKFGKEKLAVEVADDGSVGDLKTAIAEKTNVPVDNQKVIKPGKQLTDNAASLASVGVKDGSMVMVTGTTSEEAKAASEKRATAEEAAVIEKEKNKKTLCEETQHAKVLEAGPPEGAEQEGNLTLGQLPLPIDDATRVPYLRDLLNGAKQRVRLRVVSKEQVLTIATESDMKKIPFYQIHSISAETITTHDGKYKDYSILTLNLGDGGNSKLFLYFYPSQFVNNLKQILFGF
eukprot:Rhum_TRINITY_DN25708_c0_g1::Rhum_TRINITY_DN25708_c0_g1_i1::g.182649::m.182649